MGRPALASRSPRPRSSLRSSTAHLERIYWAILWRWLQNARNKEIGASKIERSQENNDILRDEVEGKPMKWAWKSFHSMVLGPGMQVEIRGIKSRVNPSHSHDDDQTWGDSTSYQILSILQSRSLWMMLVAPVLRCWILSRHHTMRNQRNLWHLIGDQSVVGEWLVPTVYLHVSLLLWIALFLIHGYRGTHALKHIVPFVKSRLHHLRYHKDCEILLPIPPPHLRIPKTCHPHIPTNYLLIHPSHLCRPLLKRNHKMSNQQKMFYTS